ncbi:MAG: D-alanyl-D-alanine carboxypeptidase/D-alanyl-D-alanine-endopeptidase [Terriglobales bacterium]
MRRARFLALLLLVLLAAQIAAAQSKALAKRIETILSDPDVSRAFWGIKVADLTTSKTLFKLNENRLFTPASNTKLFTTAATLALIGPDHKFRTTVETNGMVDKYGRLNGDLVLVGRGDPNLSGSTLPYRVRREQKLPGLQVLESLADQLVQKGLKYIDGDVVADDSYYVFERYGEGWAQDDLMWDWGAPVSALTINDNVLYVSIMPADRPGERAFVNVNPFPEYYRIDNRILTTPPGTGPRRIDLERKPGSNVLTLWGNIPVDDPGANEVLSIEDPADFAAQLFRNMLERRGIVVYGRTRARHSELASLSTITVTTMASARGGDEGMLRATPPLVLGSYESQPLKEDLPVINKVSQNLHAELMLRLLGREKGTAGTIEGGLEVLRGFLTQAGIQKDEFVFYDGSGLSRQNLVTPEAVVKLLTYIDKQPWGALYEESLPVGGVDGSLSNRFRLGAVQGRIHAKTGSLGHVNALSGYLTTLKGDRVVFSIMVNNHNLPSRRALETIDKIVEAVVAGK